MENQQTAIRRAAIVIAAVVLSPALWAQNPPTAPAAPAQETPGGVSTSNADIKQTYSKLCGGCHGDDARGTQQGPGLAGNPWVRRRSPQSLRNVIRNGIPAAGMPGFDLSAGMLDALVTMIASLNASAAKSSVPGDGAAGKQFFFGKGQCSSCHLVYGQGSPIGPDLSNVALEMTVDEIREALLQPDARIAPGYGLVSVRLRNGQTLRGFARSRTNFDLAVQDLKGAIHPLSLDEVSAITDEKRSHMEPVKAGADELRDLIAFLSRLTGVQPGAIPSPRDSGNGISFQRILDPKPGEWVTYNGNLNGNRYSDLTQINRTNVNKLSLKWTFSIPLWSQFLPDTPYYHENMRYFGLETVPIVADGIMYVTGPNQVFALDPRSGHPIWHYSRPRTAGLVSDASLGTNRGVAILEDKVFMVTDNAHLIALNRVTGRLVWEVAMTDEPQRYGGTVSPLVVKDVVIVGVSGGDWGIRGFVAA
ncbi:MAG: c-type cytochrome, partial [Gammaproteobacteria bacterium]